MQARYEQNRDFCSVSRFISEMIQDTAIVTMERLDSICRMVPFLMTLNKSFLRIPCQISRSRHLTLNISNTVRDTDIVTMEYYRGLHASYSRVSFRMTLSDLEWVGEIFNDTKQRAACLRQLSFLFLQRDHVCCVRRVQQQRRRRKPEVHLEILLSQNSRQRALCSIARIVFRSSPGAATGQNPMSAACLWTSFSAHRPWPVTNRFIEADRSQQ